MSSTDYSELSRTPQGLQSTAVTGTQRWPTNREGPRRDLKMPQRYRTGSGESRQSLRARRESGEFFLEGRIRAGLQSRTERAESRQARAAGQERSLSTRREVIWGEDKAPESGVKSEEDSDLTECCKFDILSQRRSCISLCLKQGWRTWKKAVRAFSAISERWQCQAPWGTNRKGKDSGKSIWRAKSWGLDELGGAGKGLALPPPSPDSLGPPPCALPLPGKKPCLGSFPYNKLAYLKWFIWFFVQL